MSCGINVIFVPFRSLVLSFCKFRVLLVENAETRHAEGSGCLLLENMLYLVPTWAEIEATQPSVAHFLSVCQLSIVAFASVLFLDTSPPLFFRLSFFLFLPLLFAYVNIFTISFLFSCFYRFTFLTFNVLFYFP